MNFQQKSDYENSSQPSNQNLPIVTQPMTNQMVPITHPTSNIGNQFVLTPYGQTLMVASNGTMLSTPQGQMYSQAIPSAQSGSNRIHPANAVMVNSYSGQDSAQSVSLHSNVNQIPSQSTTVNSNTGQVIAPTTSVAESEVDQTSQVTPPPYQKHLPPIIKPQNESSQPDDGDTNAMNDPPKPESQQTGQNF